MPTRIIRDGILTSEPVCSLSWAEEVFYRRLMSVADDHGRFYALPKLLRSACYPLQIDKVSDSDIGKWLTALVEAALVRVYPASDGKRYVEIVKFGQRVQSKSKFPGPEPESEDESCDPPCSTVNHREAQKTTALVVDVVEDVDGDEKRARGARDSRKVEIQTWLKALPDGDMAIPEDDPIFDYAEKVGIPLEFLELSWRRFVEDMTDRHVRKIDWRAHYRNAVKGNWLKIWWFTPTGECQLTTVGQQAARSAAA